MKLNQTYRSERSGGVRAAGLGIMALCCLASGPAILKAQSVPVPNGSFESPQTDFADPRIDVWQKAPKPVWYDESGGFLWDQLAGLFQNQAPTNSAYIDNADGKQGLYLFAVPQVAVSQDLDTKFEVGKAYDFTIGVIGGGGNMALDTSMQAALYYRDAASNVVIVASTNITYAPALFPNTTHYVDQSVYAPTVAAGAPWAGRNVGILLQSTVRPELAGGGYWDLDNVRLGANEGEIALEPHWKDGHFALTIRGPAGQKVEVLGTANLTQPPLAWSSLAILTNTTGVTSFMDDTANLAYRFYSARQVP
jgi:hypothetical protein